MPEQDQAPLLPKTLVLSYLSGGSAPTRVRRVTLAAVVILGIIHVLLALLIGGAIIHDFYEFKNRWWIMRLPWTEVLEDYLKENWPSLCYLPGLLIPAAIQLSLSRLVYRGNKLACRITLASIWPLGFCIMALTAIFIGVALLELPTYRLNPSRLLYLLVFPVGTFISMLLVDLSAYLRWIARNPLTDKPPVPFLTHRRQKIAPSHSRAIPARPLRVFPFGSIPPIKAGATIFR